MGMRTTNNIGTKISALSFPAAQKRTPANLSTQSRFKG